jgi:hypothetical protein
MDVSRASDLVVRPVSDDVRPARRMGALARVAVAITRPPWFGLYLIPAGFAVLPLCRLTGAMHSVWRYALTLVVVLLAVRFGAAVVRRIVPAPVAVRDAWRDARRLAKRDDAYQWQKLTWVGLGILLHAGVYRGGADGQVVLGVACLGLGAAGTIRRHVRSR